MNLALQPDQGKQAIREESQRHALCDGYQDLLGLVRWDRFVTLTTDPKRGNMTEHQWRKALPWFFNAWARRHAHACGLVEFVPEVKTEVFQDGVFRQRKTSAHFEGALVNQWRKGRHLPEWIACIEPHRDDRLHAHALVKFPKWCDGRMDYGLGNEVWSYGRISFEVPRDQNHVRGYCAKYVVKRGTDAMLLSQNLDIGPCRSLWRQFSGDPSGQA